MNVLHGVPRAVDGVGYRTAVRRVADGIDICRALVFNTLIIRGLPALVGERIIWYTYGIAECAVLVLAVILLKVSERNRIVFKDPQY